MSFGREVRRLGGYPDTAVGAASPGVKNFSFIALQGGTVIVAWQQRVCSQHGQL